MQEIEESEANEIRLEAMYLRRYNNQLLNHPDCRDPDHPTCELCEENDDDAQTNLSGHSNRLDPVYPFLD